MFNFKEMLLCAQLKSLFQGCSNSNTISFAELELNLYLLHIIPGATWSTWRHCKFQEIKSVSLLIVRHYSQITDVCVMCFKKSRFISKAIHVLLT